MSNQAYLIPLFPILAFVVIVFGNKIRGWRREIASYIGIASVSLAFLFALIVSYEVFFNGTRVAISVPWISSGNSLLSLGILVDPLAAMMLLVVTIVGLMVQIYSFGYMNEDKGISWYYAVLCLFTGSMLALVLARNYLQLYIFWELMGLCSYLLIGFWYEKKPASDAGKKAFLTTKVGDIGFFIGLALLFVLTRTLDFHKLYEIAEAGEIATPTLTFICIMLFCGAVGKSAQFPLHVWLPDAMEGPTPASALIHAATMVAAGVFLVARSFPLFEKAPVALAVVAVIGTFTAFFAATIAATVRDFKKVLAYSTISQLGYMVAALGVGSYIAGVFHLMTHAFFKSLLFLGAGSVMHALHSLDMYEMGGLYKKMKTTAITFLIASLSIAGVFPLAGFWSKDEILTDAFGNGYYVVFGVLLLTAFLTAFYMFRACFLTFFGEYRGKAHPHESPKVMTIPMIVLTFFAATAGLIGSPFLGNFFSKHIYLHHPHVPELNYFLMFISLAVALSGIGVAYMIYHKGPEKERETIEKIGTLYTLVQNKYYIDEIYQKVIVDPGMSLAQAISSFDKKIIDGIVNAAAVVLKNLSQGIGIFDLKIVDGVVNAAAVVLKNLSQGIGIFDLKIVDGGVNGIAWLNKKLGEGVRRIQTGNVQSYAIFIFLGEVVLIMAIMATVYYGVP